MTDIPAAFAAATPSTLEIPLSTVIISFISLLYMKVHYYYISKIRYKEVVSRNFPGHKQYSNYLLTYIILI